MMEVWRLLLRHREERVGLVVEGAVTILTAIPLKGSVAAALDHRIRPAARALTSIAPAVLLGQVRGVRLGDELVEWDRFVWATQQCHPCPLRFHSAWSPEQQSPSQERSIKMNKQKTLYLQYKTSHKVSLIVR